MLHIFKDYINKGWILTDDKFIRVNFDSVKKMQNTEGFIMYSKNNQIGDILKSDKINGYNLLEEF